MLELLLENLLNPLGVVRITLKISEEIYHIRYVTMIPDNTDPLEGPEDTLTLLDFVTLKKLTFNIKDISTVFNTNQTILDLANVYSSKYKEFLSICPEESFLNEIFFKLENENINPTDFESLVNKK